jgi:cytochrome o ubiquinol oxidase operon protein cyoD
MSQTQRDSLGATSGSCKSYTVGFTLSIVLTAIPFILVMTGALSHSATIFCLLAAAILQIFVQLHFFLHLDRSSAMYWNVLSLIFTFFIIFLFVGGSLWIMHGLHYRM